MLFQDQQVYTYFGKSILAPSLIKTGMLSRTPEQSSRLLALQRFVNQAESPRRQPRQENVVVHCYFTADYT